VPGQISCGVGVLNTNGTAGEWVNLLSLLRGRTRHTGPARVARRVPCRGESAQKAV